MAQILTDLSSEAVTIFLLSGLKSTLLMADEWALKSELRPSTLLTHSLTVLSLEQDAKRFPEGENFTQVTGAEWPQNLHRKKLMSEKKTRFSTLWNLLVRSDIVRVVQGPDQDGVVVAGCRNFFLIGFGYVVHVQDNIFQAF